MTWNYTQDRGIRYCAGTRRFQVSFKSYQSYNVAERDYVLLSWSRGYVNVSRRETEKIFSNVNPNLFYRFFVRAKNAPKRRGEFTDPKYTNVKHFGPFGEQCLCVPCCCLINLPISLPPSLPPSLPLCLSLSLSLTQSPCLGMET